MVVFFIELEKDANVGTEIKLYLNEDELSNKHIIKYIKKSMLDIKYDLVLKYLDKDNRMIEREIPAHYIREKSKDDDFKFFIPLTENGDVLEIKYEEVVSNEYIDKYEYGILIRKESIMGAHNKYVILNAGILVEQANIDNLLNGHISPSTGLYFKERGKNFKFYFNFPSNWLKIDVSRENITGFTEMVLKKYGKSFGEKIASSLYKQVMDFEKYAIIEQKRIPLIYFQEIIQNAIDFAGMNLKKKLTSVQYHLVIKITKEEIIYNVEKGEKFINKSRVSYSDEIAKKQYLKIQKKILPKIFELQSDKTIYLSESKMINIRFEGISDILNRFSHKSRRYVDKEYIYYLEKLVNRLGFDMNNIDKKIFEILTIFLIGNGYDKLIQEEDADSVMIYFIEGIALSYLTVINAEESIIVNYNDVEQNLIMESFVKM